MYTVFETLPHLHATESRQYGALPLLHIIAAIQASKVNDFFEKVRYTRGVYSSCSHSSASGAKVGDLRVTHTRPIVVDQDFDQRSEVPRLLVRAVHSCAAIRYRPTRVWGSGAHPSTPDSFSEKHRKEIAWHHRRNTPEYSFRKSSNSSFVTINCDSHSGMNFCAMSMLLDLC